MTGPRVFATIDDVRQHLADALQGVADDFDVPGFLAELTDYRQGLDDEGRAVASRSGLVIRPEYDDPDDPGPFWALVARYDAAAGR